MSRLVIQLKKGGRKQSILTCIRPDGSTTWAKLHQGIEAHDLAHFAVETELGFKDAFYGLIAKGFNIGDFELPREQRPEALIPDNLPVAAIQTEHIVNLLMVNFSEPDKKFPFIAMLEEILMKENIAYPEVLNEELLDRIRTKFQQLHMRWNKLQEGEILELTFEI